MTEKHAADWSDVLAASRMIEGQARRTPVMTAEELDRQLGARLYFKCENFQRMGAFKFRGAFNALSRLTADERKRGVVAFSSGNHAQAVALSAKLLGIQATIVMPEDAPPIKIRNTRAQGAEVVLYRRGIDSREAIADKISKERNAVAIPPFDHPHVIAGQGTLAKELIEEAGALDLLLVCVGGGGLIAGCAMAAKHLCPGIRVIGVEPAAGDDVTRSFRTRTRQRVDNPQTIADGARTEMVGELTFPILLDLVDDMVTVSDEELLSATFYCWQQMKMVVEPTGALAAAAAMSGKVDVRGLRVGVVISGGNADIARLAPLLPA